MRCLCLGQKPFYDSAQLDRSTRLPLATIEAAMLCVEASVKPRGAPASLSPQCEQTSASTKAALEARVKRLEKSLERVSSEFDRHKALSKKAPSESRKKLTACRAALTQSVEQQTAGSEILGVIARSSDDLQPTFNACRQG